MNIMPTFRYTLLGIFSCLLLGNVHAQRDLKHIPDPTPAVQEASFQVADGFEVNLFASDPMIAKPVQMNWDARGRLWIVSSKIYPQIEPGQEAQDEILVIEDTDGDGKADKKTVFADGLLIPTGVLPADGGAYVANSTEVLFMRDTDGDGRADEKQVVLSGFGTEDTHHIIHTFRGGPDGMVYFNQSIYIHSHVETPWGVERLLGGGLWHFRPESRELGVFCKGFVNPWGHVFNRWGQSFATDGAYGEGVNYVFPGGVFCTSPGAKRILSGMSPGQPKQCGLAVLSGRHLPESWQGQVVTNDFRGHRVNRFAVNESNSSYTARQQEDLIWTNHGGFRPIGVEMGPDGAIYIADWYNPIIQHGEVDFRDERRDQTHGRIWRITAQGRPLVSWPNIEQATDDALLELLRAPEDLTRHHAKQQLRQRDHGKVSAAVTAWVGALDPKDPQYEHLRLEALWTLQGINRLDEDLLNAVLKSSDHRARAAAVRVIYHWHMRLPEAVDLLGDAVSDPHAQVRLEAVNALRVVGSVPAFQLAMSALDQPIDESLDFALWLTARDMETIWLPAMQSGEFAFPNNIQQIFALRAIENPAAIKPLVEDLQKAKSLSDEIDGTLKLISDLGDADDLGVLFNMSQAEATPLPLKRRALEWLNAAATQRKAKPVGDLNAIVVHLSGKDEVMQRLACESIGLWKLEGHQEALQTLAEGEGASIPVVKAALNGLRLFGSSSEAYLETLSASVQPLERRFHAAAGLAQVQLKKGAERAAALLSTSKEDSPAIQDLWTTFLSMKEGPSALAEALSKRSLPRPVAYAGIQKANAAGERAIVLIKALTNAAGLEPVNQDLSEAEMAALVDEVRNQGDPHRGEFIYRRQELQCSVCHALGGAGGNLGPDMISLGASAPIDYIVESLLAPNNKVKEGYHMTTVYTKDDRVLSGFVALEDDRQLVLRDATGLETTLALTQVKKKEIASVSMMPPGLTASLRRDEFIHLVRFMSELGKEGSFKVPPRRLVRRWRVLNFTDAIKESVRQGDQRFYALKDDVKEWLPTYSTVRGVLPVNAIPSAKRWLNLVAPLRFEVDVTASGMMAIQFNASLGMRAWVGETEVTLDADRITTELEIGHHTITLVLDRNAFPKPTLEAELVDVEGSTAAVQLTSGT